jgi:hypothetical protein
MVKMLYTHPSLHCTHRIYCTARIAMLIDCDYPTRQLFDPLMCRLGTLRTALSTPSHDHVLPQPLTFIFPQAESPPDRATLCPSTFPSIPESSLRSNIIFVTPENKATHQTELYKAPKEHFTNVFVHPRVAERGQAPQYQRRPQVFPQSSGTPSFHITSPTQPEIIRVHLWP